MPRPWLLTLSMLVRQLLAERTLGLQLIIAVAALLQVARPRRSLLPRLLLVDQAHLAVSATAPMVSAHLASLPLADRASFAACFPLPHAHTARTLVRMTSDDGLALLRWGNAI